MGQEDVFAKGLIGVFVERGERVAGDVMLLQVTEDLKADLVGRGWSVRRAA